MQNKHSIENGVSAEVDLGESNPSDDKDIAGPLENDDDILENNETPIINHQNDPQLTNEHAQSSKSVGNGEVKCRASPTNSLYRIDGQKNTALVDELKKTQYAESLEDYRMKVTTCRCIPKRYVLAVMSFFGFFNVYCLRVDISVALVAMTNNHTRMTADGNRYWVSVD